MSPPALAHRPSTESLRRAAGRQHRASSESLRADAARLKRASFESLQSEAAHSDLLHAGADAAHAGGVRPPVFRPRRSPLDVATLERANSPLLGVVVGSWVCMAYYLAAAAHQCWRETGSPIQLGLGPAFWAAAREFVAVEAVTIVSLFLNVLLQKLLAWRLLPQSKMLAIQHAWQAAWFSMVMWALFSRDWPWLISGAFSMHAIVMLLKTHSYNAANIEFSGKRARMHELRMLMMARKRSDNKQGVEALQYEIDELQRELVRANASYPGNITAANFASYLLMPVFIYELEYPRTKRIRPLYLLLKIFELVLAAATVSVVYQREFRPRILNIRNVKEAEFVLELSLYTLLLHNLVPYIVYDCVPNIMAELTCFADRNFYGEWWSSSSYSEMARNVNRPVHHFLRHHVYGELMIKCGLSRAAAMAATFALSGALHELVVTSLSRRLRFHLMSAMMGQLVMIFAEQWPPFRGRRFAGLVMFWTASAVGIPGLFWKYFSEPFE
ncbi:Sterol O-acyltransferase 2 (Sterol-ester synthase 2) [Polyrhizophydium stewartii]|uniref:Sterol O-acyltransferase 2 (Sterol-ester synthase 2) n=1 Tax=Polyrhizophydium stewartii TaxID=2732419 RepID=A0ABR4NKS6_9FUNG